MQVLHIVSSFMASRGIYHGEVMVLPSWQLPFGRLFRDFSLNEIERYCNDFKGLNALSSAYPFAVCLMTLLKHDFSVYDKIVVWWRKDIYDQLFLYLICKIIPVPICEIKEEDEIYKQYICCSQYKTFTNNIIAKIRPIPSEVQIENAKLWDELSKSDSNLRLLKNNQILSVNIDYFDDVILRKVRKGKIRFDKLAAKLATTSSMGYYLDYQSIDFFENRLMYLIHDGKLQPYILKKGHLHKSNYEEVLRIDVRGIISLSLSRNVVLPVEKRTLYLFPDKVKHIYNELLGDNDAIYCFPAWILPYCKLPKGFDLMSWETYGKNVVDLLKLNNQGIVNSLRSFFEINFDEFDRVVIAHTNSVPDTLFLYLVSALINTDKLYEIDITHCSDSSSGVDSEKLRRTLFLPETPSKITTEKRNELVRHWDYITSSTSELRVSDDCGNIINVPIDYLDNMIIDYCNTKYMNIIELTVVFAQSGPFGLNNSCLERFSLVRLVELARKGAVFIYGKNNKGDLYPKEIEPMTPSELKKIYVLKKRLPITPSLFD